MPKEKRKLDAKSTKRIFIGQAEPQKGTKCMVQARSNREKSNPNRYWVWVDSDTINLESSSKVEDHAEHANVSTVSEANIEEP